MIPVALSTFLIGFATGGRNMTGLAALALTSTPGRDGELLDRAATPVGRGVLGAAALGELVNDKNPRIPSRTAPGPLVIRAATGALVGALLSRREGWAPWPGAGMWPGAAIGAAGAVAGSFAGREWRRLFESSPRLEMASAVVEDLATVGIALTATGVPHPVRI